MGYCAAARWSDRALSMATPFPPRLQSSIQSIIGTPNYAIKSEVSDFAGTGHAVHTENKCQPTRDQLLSVADIVRALRNYRYNPAFTGSRRVPLSAIAQLCGLTRETIYQARRGVMSETTRTKLTTVIGWINEDKVRFRRNGQQWGVEWRTPPDPLPLPQDKLVRASDWNEWSQCRTCSGLRWSPIVMTNARWYVCDQCVPKNQWPAIGATTA